MENKIYNQDCLDVMREMNNESIDLLLTDIPYGGVNRKSNGLRNLDKKDADIFTNVAKNRINTNVCNIRFL